MRVPFHRSNRAIQSTIYHLTACVSLGVSLAMLPTIASAAARQPRGIYANIEPAVAPNTGFEPKMGRAPDFEAILNNPAVSGVSVGLNWATFQPQKGQFDFSLLDGVFAIATAKHKTVQLILLPGFGTPRWVLDNLPSCDPILSGGGGGGQQCGKATFVIAAGPRKGDSHELPLPWNARYKYYWQMFLKEVAKHYGQNPAFVSIAIAGPTALSAEMILPHSPEATASWARLLEMFYPDPSYHRTTRAFVEEWKAEIDDYGRIFSDVTLVLTFAQGFPFNPKGDRDAAQREIADYFVHANLGTNAKATQTSGMRASRGQGPSVREVKELTADTRSNPRILGGAQFDTSFSRFPGKEGCIEKEEFAPECQNITPDRALYNVLGVFFEGTPHGHIFGVNDGTVPMHYMQIYAPDIYYVNEHPTEQARLMDVSRRLLGR